MRTIVFQGGLGNQLFQYLFLKYAERTWNGSCQWMYDGHSHNGMIIQNYFDISLPRHASPRTEKIYQLNKRILRRLGWNLFIGNDTNNNLKYKPFLSGYWQDKKYFHDDLLSFQELNLSEKNQKLLNEIQFEGSIALHVRRGDYLLPKFASIYGEVCTLEYYQRAIDICNSKIKNPCYYVFSDDMEWVKQNLTQIKAVFVDWNYGEDSIFDLYLMSHAHVNIIANSSFSYWAAKLNRRNNLVIYPSKWYNPPYKTPDIFPDDWIGI